MIKTILIIIISVAIFGLIIFVLVKNALKRKIDQLVEDEKKSDKYIKGVSCSNCFDKTTDKQKARYKSRQDQIDIAKKRNKKHIGPRDEIYN